MSTQAHAAKPHSRAPLRLLMRSHCQQALTIGQRYALDDDQTHHAFRVRRLDDDTPVIAWTGTGQAWLARLHGSAKSAEIEILSSLADQAQSQPAIHILQALPEGDKMDWILEKCTELGASGFYPVAAARSVVKLQAERLQKRHQQWLQRLETSCNQCGLYLLPALEPVQPLASLLANANRRASPPALQLWLDPAAPVSLHERLAALDAAVDASFAVWIAVGPEGGWTEQETALASQHNWLPTRVHHLTLRTETAALVAMAQIQALSGPAQAATKPSS